MDKQKRQPKYSPEVRERAVRMVLEHRSEHASEWAAIVSVAAKIRCTAQSLHNWVKQTERDQRARAGPTTDERARMKELERENRELRQGEPCPPLDRGQWRARSCARRAPILPRRSSTAGSSHDRLH